MIPHQIMTPEQTAEFLSERRQAVIGIDRKHGPPILNLAPFGIGSTTNGFLLPF